MKASHIVIASALVGALHVPSSLAGTPTIYMQSATLSGASNIVTIGRVPVQDAAGKITY
jgi:hypothetical protein